MNEKTVKVKEDPTFMALEKRVKELEQVVNVLAKAVSKDSRSSQGAITTIPGVKLFGQLAGMMFDGGGSGGDLRFSRSQIISDLASAITKMGKRNL